MSWLIVGQPKAREKTMAVTKQHIKNEETNLSAMLKVGDKLVAFWIDGVVASYGEGEGVGFTVEAVGTDWVAVRDARGKPLFASVASWSPDHRHQISTIVAKLFSCP
jgi:hypothetical protein